MQQINSAVNKEIVYTTQDAARLLGMSVSTVQKMVESGVLAAWKTEGGHRRIPASAIEQILANKHAVTPTCDPAPCADKFSLKILILEDDAIQRRIYEHRIEQWQLPLDITFCNDGYSALIEVALQQPEILLLDIVMEGIDGYEVLKAITNRSSFRLSHIAVLTNLSEHEIEQRGGLPPGVLYLPKPINLDELKGYLRGCCTAKARMLSKPAKTRAR